MKWNIRQSVLVLMGSSLLAGCASHSQHAVTVTPSGQVMVPDREDQARREKAGMPGIGPYAWNKGYWTFADGRWVWVPGQWLEPANPTNQIEGYWERSSTGWVWIPGHPA